MGGRWRGAARRSDRGKGTGYVIRFSKSEYTARTCLHNNVSGYSDFDTYFFKFILEI